MTDRSFDRIADAFLAQGPIVLPDRVLTAAFEEVHRTRQRRDLWRAPWRFTTMNTFAKFAVAAVAVIAVGFLGLTVLRPDGSGVGGSPSAVPSATVAPTPTATATAIPTPAPTAAPLTGQFTSQSHGYSVSYPVTWSTRPATAPWTTEYLDWFNESGDLLYDESSPGDLWLSIASQPLGDRTLEEFEADVSQTLKADDPDNAACAQSADSITIDGAQGLICGQLALVTDGGRGYWVMLYTGGDDPGLIEAYDDAWFRTFLATLKLLPEDAVDAAGSAS